MARTLPGRKGKGEEALPWSWGHQGSRLRLRQVQQWDPHAEVVSTFRRPPVQL